MKYVYKGALAYSSHNQIVDMVVKNGSKKILEVGCNEGFIGRALREKKWDGFLTGIDKDNYYKKVVDNGIYDKFINIDVERKFDKVKDTYDGIIFADVLEHLDNPLEVLIKSKKKIKRNGFFMISLPNVANLFIRVNLLFGNFTYLDYGVLDKKHRHFFTYKTAKDLIKKTGFVLTDEVYTPVPTPLLNNFFALGSPFFFVYYLARFLSIIRKQVFGYQFIFVCKKKKSI